MKNHIDITLERQKVLSVVAMQLSEINDFKGKSQQLINTIGPLSKAESIHTYRWDEPTRKFIIVSSWYIDGQYRNDCLLYCHSMFRDEIPDELYDLLYQGKAQICDKRLLPVTQMEWVRTSIIYGFTALDKLQGILVYSTSRCDGWDDFSVEWLHTIASMISSAVKRTFIYDKLQQELAWRDKVYPIIAHDLRSGVGTIKMLSQGVDSTNDIDEIREINKMIARNADDTFMLLDNLLKWSRSQTSSSHVSLENVEIVSLIRTVVDMYEQTASIKEIKIEFVTNSDVFNIEVDIEMIRTVARNIISNAIKFTPNGGLIRVVCQVVGVKVTVSIEDNGVGIPSHVLNQIKVGSDHVTTYGTQGEKGSGLGLSLVRDFLRLHNSELMIDSEQGRGTKMYFIL